MGKRYYETMFVVRTDIPEEERNALAEKVRGWIEGQLEGEVEEFTRWGIRKLAYRTQKGKFTEGDYTYIIYKADPEKVNQLDDLFKVNQEIFRFQTIRREDLEKKVRKTQKESKIMVEEPETSEEI
ncbi:30S ribosomal protein S6 [Petrotoga olearia]|uniref:Small ribosomal subunit protein bS6 n=2 Tax=Petrotoga olearia TaxID=156203 RepID=A0A2K1P160_9BACT|nr:30S ribosomal protein S6 [Petrotoga olearia]KUK15885.1 MAG: 30S ribosomal protein S6 [Petrotoga mobilis]PNR96516.1 30S ribosomal protein S6 [Petrotoga olearia DSM 13574]RMA76387.1 SSU ribosomal protein S6P [Petrotoga olearia]HBT51846.1 30S ribosomal protein S6 [Petrotoga sp.]